MKARGPGTRHPVRIQRVIEPQLAIGSIARTSALEPRSHPVSTCTTESRGLRYFQRLNGVDYEICFILFLNTCDRQYKSLEAHLYTGSWKRPAPCSIRKALERSLIGRGGF